MSKVRNWIGVVSAPILFASAGCSMGQRSYPTANRGLSAERMMSLAQTFERQGHLPQAKYAYFQVLAAQPGNPEAQQSLNNLIAKETQQQRFGAPGQQPNPLMNQSTQSYAINGRPVMPVQQPSAVAPIGPKLPTAGPAVYLPTTEIPRVSEIPMPVPIVPSLSSLPTAPLVPVTLLLDAQPPAAPEQSPVVTETLLVEQSSVMTPAPVAISQLPVPETLTVVESTLVVETIRIEQQPPAVISEPVAPTESVGSAILSEAKVQLDEPQPLSVSASTPAPAAAATPSKRIDPSLNAVETELEFLPPIKSRDGALGADDKEIESALSEHAGIDLNLVADRELHPFFGTFHAGLVEILKVHRVGLQSQLAELVVNQAMGNEIRSRAIFLLGTLGPDAIDVAPKLRRVMHDDLDMYLRVDLAEAILKIQPEDVDAINMLVICLKQPNKNLKWVAAFALRNAVSPRTTFVIDSLRQLLPTDDLKLQRMVFLTLAEFGPAAAKAIPELEAALNSPDPATREVAKASLACIIAPPRTTDEDVTTTSLQTE